MNIKKIATAFLILFVAASVGTIVAKERNAQTAPQSAATTPATKIIAAKPAASMEEQPVSTAPTQAQNASPVASTPTVQETASLAKVVVYYFHGNMRCATCHKIEAYTTEAIQTGFADDVKNGHLELKVINVEEPANAHYVQDYQLALRSVVVARYEGQEQKEWKRLDEVWKLAGDKDAFIRMVQDETAALLKGKN